MRNRITWLTISSTKEGNLNHIQSSDSPQKKKKKHTQTHTNYTI